MRVVLEGSKTGFSCCLTGTAYRSEPDLVPQLEQQLCLALRRLSITEASTKQTRLNADACSSHESVCGP